MQSFKDRIAVLTGGGTGMGRELARQLSAEGCHVAMCDISAENMEETRALCLDGAPDGTRVTTFVADVSHEEEILAFREAVQKTHATDRIHLLFNNAGIGGGGSFILDGREEWEKTFDVCWKGVYYGCRAFLPMLVASKEAHLVNTSSVNGLWATLGPNTSHTAYSAAKFAVRGFTEALVTDLRLHAPHVKVSLVMPGHVGTSILINSGKLLGIDPENLSADQVARIRERGERIGLDTSGIDDQQLAQLVVARGEAFRDHAPTTAAQAAEIILQAVRDERWRVLVGDDAQVIDEMVRAEPEQAYEAEFFERLLAKTGWAIGS